MASILIKKKLSALRSVRVLATLFCLFFIACSSGGGGGGDKTNTAPTVSDCELTTNVNTIATGSLDGSDADGDDLTFSMVAGAAQGTVSIVDAATGAYTYTPNPDVSGSDSFTFKANDGVEDSNTATVSITIVSSNGLPVADAGPDHYTLENTSVILDGSSSRDSDGTIAAFQWTQVSGTPVDLNNADQPSADFVTPSATGLLVFRLTVTDDEGAEDSDEVTVSVANLIFEDDFNSGPSAGWTVVDDSINTSNWRGLVGQYFQENYVEDKSSGAPFDESYHRGTYSYRSDLSSMTDYRFSVQITPLIDDGDFTEGNDVGVMFRYQDPNNYYRLSISARYGFTRLEKRTNGTFYPLAVDSIGYIERDPLYVTISVAGDIVQVYVNDDPLFTVTDSDLDSGSIALYCQDRASFENVLVTGGILSPAVIISQPLANSVATTGPGSASDLPVSAVATNAPAGAQVEFVLDGTTTLVDSNPPYAVTFNAVPAGNHTVEAVLKDSEGSELSRDTNEYVGIRGNYHITVGDSISNGIDDNYAADNISDDQRIVSSQGYQANLNNLLTSTLGVPHIVFNEGIGGDNAQEADDLRIDSILARHPDATTALVLLGTNSSSSEGNFAVEMQSVVAKIRSAGITPWVAKIPPAFHSDTKAPNASQNNRIGGYNGVIDGLSNIEQGPDFYTFFYDKPSLISDDVHPNAYGFVIMSYLWHNSLAPGSPQDLPLILDSLTPQDYQQNLIEVGDTCYIDQDVSVTNIPAILDGGIWIMTENGDADNSSADFITFDIDRDVEVFVAYDSDATTSGWLSGFTDTGLQISTTPNGAMDLYSRAYSSSDNPITLGGNRNDGGTGAFNYLVIVKE
jgi:hypothetical protein